MIEKIKFLNSPNKSFRGTSRIDVIVIHATAGSFDSALSWMMNVKSFVSAHYLIGKDGRVVQLVKEAFKAWHAGASKWGKDLDINPISIGIELENNNDGKDPYPEEQIKALSELCNQIMKRHPKITEDRILGHNQISPGRKTDPNKNFPWDKFKKYLKGE